LSKCHLRVPKYYSSGGYWRILHKFVQIVIQLRVLSKWKTIEKKTIWVIKDIENNFWYSIDNTQEIWHIFQILLFNAAAVVGGAAEVLEFN